MTYEREEQQGANISVNVVKGVCFMMVTPSATKEGLSQSIFFSNIQKKKSPPTVVKARSQDHGNKGSV